MLLKEYVEYVPDIKQFCDLLEISKEHLNGYFRGKNRFSTKLAKRIERISKGKVSEYEVLSQNRKSNKELTKELSNSEKYKDVLLDYPSQQHFNIEDSNGN